MFSGCSSLSSITVSSVNKNFAADGGVLFDHSKETLIRFPQAKIMASYSIPSTVTTIAEDAFAGCLSLSEITVESGNTKYTIQDKVLVNSDEKTLIRFPSGDKRPKYSIPDGITKISAFAFEGSSLASITIPEGVTEIGSSAFEKCLLLSEIVVQSDNEYFASEDGILFDHDKTELIRFPPANKKTFYSLPSGTEYIGTYAFSDCSGLSRLGFSETISSLDTV